MLYCRYPIISHSLLKEYVWFYFYRYAKENIPPNITEKRGHKVSIYMFDYSVLAGYKFTRCRQMGVLMFMNKTIIYWYIKMS